MVAGQLQHARTLYVSDLDATLLRSDGTLSAASVAHINSAIASGALFTYATARSAYAVANAVHNVRARASAVIGSNDDDAVAKWILQDINRLPTGTPPG